ncbi:helix-turn-helix domain-containing protein [uncultured Ruminococcus sp.]|uniref:helix-turn-helix domain-containing protein n=1 Tax=uncultured Ruminococcus sp. TaxID=165186 RepID=UPI00292F8988|nr:helix-turn-helix domain-containing protein [uncultured Ruminococcus sp.]
MTREQLSAATRIPVGKIQDYECNNMALYYESASVIADALNIKSSLLLDEYTEFCKPGYGKRIRTIRIQSGLTQEQFSERLGFTRSNESTWEDELNNRRPNRESYRQIQKMAIEAGLDVKKLIDDPDTYTDEYAVFIERDCGKKIRQIRLAHGVVTKVFAEKIGCDWQTLEHWEIDRAKPLRKYYEPIKQAAREVGIDLDMLNVEPDYFVSDYQGFIQTDCGRKIKSIRIACGCGLNQFGRILGCTGEAVARWEKNICVPELKYYKQIEQAANDNGLSIKSLNETPVPIKDEYKEFCESEFGEVVKAIRRNYHLKQIDFGRMIGVSLSTIGNWETRRAIPDREHFAKLKEIAARKGVSLYDA